MNLREKIEDNVVIWLLGVAVASFSAGFGAYHAILQISGQETVASIMRGKAEKEYVAKTKYDEAPKKGQHAEKTVVPAGAFSDPTKEKWGILTPERFPNHEIGYNAAKQFYADLVNAGFKSIALFEADDDLQQGKKVIRLIICGFDNKSDTELKLQEINSKLPQIDPRPRQGLFFSKVVNLRSICMSNAFKLDSRNVYCCN